MQGEFMSHYFSSTLEVKRGIFVGKSLFSPLPAFLTWPAIDTPAISLEPATKFEVSSRLKMFSFFFPQFSL